MTLRQIEFFLAVCKKKSFSSAAKSKYVSQQTISKAVRELEEELGCELFQRQSTGVTLTACGQHTFEEFSRIERHLNKLPEKLCAIQMNQRTEIHISLAYGALSSIGNKLFDCFQEKHPELKLILSDAPDLVVEENVKSGKVDIGIAVGPVDTRQFEAQFLKKEAMYLCIHKDHPLYQETNITMEHLRGQTFINMGDSFKAYYNLRQACEHAGFEPHVSYTSNEIITLLELTSENKGLFPTVESKAYTPSSDVRFAPFPDPYFNYSLYIINRIGQEQTPGVAALKHYLLDNVGKQSNV